MDIENSHGLIINENRDASIIQDEASPSENDGNIFSYGDIVKHFKRETLTGDKGTKYLYMIIGTARHTETGEILMLYKPLYGPPPCLEGVGFAARPLDMFLSDVDHEKYPNIKQKKRFELYKGDIDE